MTRLPSSVVGPEWLSQHRDDVAVVHVGWVHDRPDAARRAFEAGHIPGAAFLDADGDLSGRAFVDGPGRHPLPAPERFAETMARTGVSDGSSVLAYDHAGGSLAARLWWMLDVTGHRVAVLDGGLETWVGPRETGPESSRTPGSFTPRPWPVGGVTDAAGVEEALASHSATVLDARAGERFRGEIEPIDPVAGHIPGARNAEWTGNLDERGQFLPPRALRERFKRLGVIGDRRVIAHCGSGITACHSLLALRRAGLDDGILYEGSWSDWVSDGTREVATGDE